MDLEKIIRHQREFAEARDWDQFHTPKNLAMALVAEGGELLELFQWLTEEQAGRVMQSPERAEAVRHELADIFFYLARLADKLGVDLEAAFWEKMRENEKKYPADLARGNAKKYTEL